MSRIVLASKSAARKALLEGAGVAFHSVSAGVDEDVLKVELLERGAGPKEVALALAEAKALAAAAEHDGLVIGADSTLDHDGRLIDKALTPGEARARLIELRGTRHELHSAVAVACGGELLWRTVDTAALVMRPFSDAYLDAYMDRQGVAVLSSVGCYQLESEGVQLFERIEGDYFTVLGLPLLPLLAFLRSRGALPE